MELLIASAIGALGWTLARADTGHAPTAPNLSSSGAAPLPIGQPAQFSSETVASLQRRHEDLAKKRWAEASDPTSGIIGPSRSHVPFFSSFRKQHTNDDLKQRRMEIYSGNDGGTAWNHKTETGPRFSLKPQAVTSSGSSGNAPSYDPARYLNSSTGVQNNTLPFKQVRVGPGVGVGSSTAAAEGFHSTFRPLPPDLGYKKNALEGRINPGTAVVTAREVDPKMYSKNIPRYWDMERRPLEKGRAAATGQSIRPETKIKGRGACHVDTEEYYGPAGTLGHRVADGAWGRNASDGRPGLPLTNIASAASGMGGFVGTAYDRSRFDAQQRETPGQVASGAVRGDQFRHQSSASFVAAPTTRSLQNTGYGGLAGHFVSSGTAHPLDAPQPTIREQLHEQTTGLTGAAPITKGQTIQCTNRQLLKESKRGSQVINTYVTGAERTDAFRRARVGDDQVTARCQSRMAVKRDERPGTILSHGAAGAMYMNQATPGNSTTANRNKLPEVNPFQDYNIAKINLQTNDLHVSIV